MLGELAANVHHENGKQHSYNLWQQPVTRPWILKIWRQKHKTPAEARVYQQLHGGLLSPDCGLATFLKCSLSAPFWQKPKKL